MSFTKVTLKRLSICACGYGVLKDEITAGTEFEIDLSTVRDGFVYGCGGCGAIQCGVRIVLAKSLLNPEDMARPLPYDLFCEAQ